MQADMRAWEGFWLWWPSWAIIESTNSNPSNTGSASLCYFCQISVASRGGLGHTAICPRGHTLRVANGITQTSKLRDLLVSNVAGASAWLHSEIRCTDTCPWQRQWGLVCSSKWNESRRLPGWWCSACVSILGGPVASESEITSRGNQGSQPVKIAAHISFLA